MMNIAGFFSQFPGFVGALSLSVAAMASAAASAQTTKPTILLVHGACGDHPSMIGNPEITVAAIRDAAGAVSP
jgi:hypothetical protein